MYHLIFFLHRSPYITVCACPNHITSFSCWDDRISRVFLHMSNAITFLFLQLPTYITCSLSSSTLSLSSCIHQLISHLFLHVPHYITSFCVFLVIGLVFLAYIMCSPSFLRISLDITCCFPCIYDIISPCNYASTALYHPFLHISPYFTLLSCTHNLISFFLADVTVCHISLHIPH